jgi:uncharacterized protein YndB with AHSA1/START domain
MWFRKKAPLPSLCLRRTIIAPPELVFQAWTEADELKHWWGPEGYSTPDARIDLRVGGSYRLTMVGPMGNTFYLSGSYRTVQPPHKLVYTWSWEGTSMDGPETLVTVEFRDRGGVTEVVVSHELPPGQALHADHVKVWEGSLDRLADHL